MSKKNNKKANVSSPNNSQLQQTIETSIINAYKKIESEKTTKNTANTNNQKATAKEILIFLFRSNKKQKILNPDIYFENLVNLFNNLILEIVSYIFLIASILFFSNIISILISHNFSIKTIINMATSMIFSPTLFIYYRIINFGVYISEQNKTPTNNTNTLASLFLSLISIVISIISIKVS